MKLWGVILILLWVSVPVWADQTCSSQNPWPKNHEPMTPEELIKDLEALFQSMFHNDMLTADEELPRALATSEDTPPVAASSVILQDYLRRLNVNLQRIFLKEVEAIEHISNPQERRQRAYDAWYENRIAASAVAVFLRTVKFDRDFRTLMYAAHGDATRELAKHLMFLAWLQKLIDTAKEAVEKGGTVPKPHPLHTLDAAQLKDRVNWISQVLLEQTSHKYGWFAKVAATDYGQELARYRMIQARHQVAMDRLWRVLQATTWFHNRWLWRMGAEIDVMRNRYANATFATKAFLPSVVVLGTAMAIIGDFAGLKAFLKRLLEAFLGP